MSKPRTISFRIPAATVDQLDTLAQAMRRDRSFLLNEAVEAYLCQQERFRASVEEGLRAADAGQLIEDGELGSLLEHWLQNAAARSKIPA